MKKCFVAMFAFVSLFILTGCADSPKKVAEKWFKVLIDGDLKAANAVSTAKTQAKNAEVIHYLFIHTEEWDKIKQKKTQFVKETIDGDKATVIVKSEGEKGDDITLVKQDGKWLVDTSESIVSSPQKVVEKWFNAIMDGDLKAANAVCTATSQVNNAKGIYELYEDTETWDELKKQGIQFKEEIIDGDKATVTIKIATHDFAMNLVKQDGKWLVDAPR